MINTTNRYMKTLNLMIPQSRFSQYNDLSPIQVKKTFKYYRPSEKINTLFTSRFDFRFKEIKNSLVTQGFFAKVRSFYRWHTQYENLSVPKNIEELERALPITENPDFTCSQSKIKYTWIGHSTAVINIGGQTNILIDPLFSERCSPLKSFGPKRYREAPCSVCQLPKIDIVLVSHDHYDHLDTEALNQLQRIHKPVFFAGLNSKDTFPANANLNELDWTETKKIIVNDNEFQITFIPACHWSRRGLFDTGKRLWGGFVIKTPKGKKIYYSGDTGYCDVFKELSEVFGNFDLCVLPIGVYEPRQFLKNQHTNPDEAVRIHKELKSKKSVGVHWGTFPLSSQKWDAPREQLIQAVKTYGLKQGEFVTVNHGDSFEIDY